MLSDDVKRCLVLAIQRERFHPPFGKEDAKAIRNVLAELERLQAEREGVPRFLQVYRDAREAGEVTA